MPYREVSRDGQDHAKFQNILCVSAECILIITRTDLYTCKYSLSPTRHRKNKNDNKDRCNLHEIPIIHPLKYSHNSKAGLKRSRQNKVSLTCSIRNIADIYTQC